MNAMAEDSSLNIFERVAKKKQDYQLYNFARLQEEAFATFFDLAQEYTSLETLYQICVAVPKEFFQLESRLYILSPKNMRLEQVCSSEDGLISGKDRHAVAVELSEEKYETDHACVLPIRGNRALTDWIRSYSQSRTLGMFEIYPKDRLTKEDHFFFEKFTNRIGYNLHQKLLIKQNIEHIKFINQLVSDIEHNVITPNLYYKLFIRQSQKCLNNYSSILQRLRETILCCQTRHEPSCHEMRSIYDTFSENNQTFDEQLQALSKHYEHNSLFLETLLRRDHFQQGTYVLRRQPCNFRTEILEPLLERYQPILQRKGIAINDRLGDIPDEEITLFVDKGLISQVFDNLFSNAAKYTREVEDQAGNQIKFLSTHRKILKNYFGEGVHGIEFSIFTTGKPIPEKELVQLFEEGFRSSSAGSEQGTGHGLHFIRNVVEIHGGEVGCTPQRFGNEFYFVLPLKEALSWAGREQPLPVLHPAD
jgi:signal transduction histidine kinase